MWWIKNLNSSQVVFFCYIAIPLNGAAIAAASNAVGEAARERFSVSGKVAGAEDIVAANNELSHYLKTTETMKVSAIVFISAQCESALQVSAAPSPMEINKAVRTMYPAAAVTASANLLRADSATFASGRAEPTRQLRDCMLRLIYGA